VKGEAEVTRAFKAVQVAELAEVVLHEFHLIGFQREILLCTRWVAMAFAEQTWIIGFS
jgi:hypothetical protein